MTFELDLSGRRALVTGAGQGVGRGIALALASAGASVVVNDLDQGRADAVADEITAAGGEATTSVFDVTDYPAVTAAVDGAGLDVLVNNAGNAGAEGMASLSPFLETEPADWEPYLRVNLYGPLYCARAALPGMVERGWGRVITIVSDAARTGDKYMAAYSTAKAGAAGLTRALAREVGQHGVTANNISLGTMRTPMTEPVWSDPDNPVGKALMQHYVVRRPGAPEDVAALVVFLASPQAAWITGQTYPVNGGYSFAM